MKVKQYSALLALLMTSGFLYAAPTVIPAVNTPVTVQGNAVVEGTALVNGTLTVQPAIGTVVSPPVVTPGSGVATELTGTIGGAGGPVRINETIIDTNMGVQTSSTGGGATIQTNGDTELNSSSGTRTTVDYGRVVTFEVAQAGNSNPIGLAIPGTAKYYVTNEATGAYISGPYPTEAALNAFLATQTPATLLAIDPTLGTSEAIPGTGGNLYVHGSTRLGDSPTDTTTISGPLTVNGASVTSGITNTNGLTSTGATQLNGTLNAGATTTASLTNTGNATVGGTFGVTGATTTRGITNTGAIGTDTLTVQGATELKGLATTNGIANTGAIGTDTLLVRGASELRGLATTNGIANTGAIGTDTLTVRGVASMNGINNNNARITNLGEGVLRSDAATFGQLTDERDARIAADNVLSSNIQENTRGIAMVAAMTNTRVEAGKCHGIDFNMAQFQSETGFAFGYANRINDNVQVHGSIASTTDFDESVVRVGVAFQW